MGIGIFVAGLGLVLSIKFLNFSAKETTKFTNDDQRIIPKLKEIAEISVINEAGSIYVLSLQELAKLKKYLNRVVAINSTGSVAKRYTVEVKDIYDGLWSFEAVTTHDGRFEFVSNRRHFGGEKMSDIGQLLRLN